MEKNNYKNELMSIFNAKQLCSSKIVRNDNNLFTFSPIQDEIAKFNQDLEGVYYKEQVCFRHVYPSNLINPLSTPCQKLISIFSFKNTEYVAVINRFVKEFLKEKVSKENIYIIVPDINDIVSNVRFVTSNIIPIDPKRLQCEVPLNGYHYYIKICIKYRNGLVTVMNFVLIDYTNELFSKIDSVFFPLRMDMIDENAKSIYETSNYISKFVKMYNVVHDYEKTHFLISQLEAIEILKGEIGKVSNHKHGYALKKLAREVFLECDYNNISAEKVFEVYPMLEDELRSLYSVYSKNIKSAIKKIEKSKTKISAKYAYETLGLPVKMYKMMVDNDFQLEELPRNFAYYRDETKNEYQNPIERYR